MLKLRTTWPLDPRVFRLLYQGTTRHDAEIVTGRDGAAAVRLTAANAEVSLEEPSAAILGTVGVVTRIPPDTIVFLDANDLVREAADLETAREARRVAARERTEQIRKQYPIVVPADGGVLDALLAIRRRRYGVYRRSFGTSAVEGTLEPVSEVNYAIGAWIQAVQDALPFRTEVRHAAQSFTGGVTSGGDHIAVTDRFEYGRLVREPGDPLCKPSRRFFDLIPGESADCAVCARIAERIIDPKPRTTRRRSAKGDLVVTKAAPSSIAIAPADFMERVKHLATCRGITFDETAFRNAACTVARNEAFDLSDRSRPWGSLRQGIDFVVPDGLVNEAWRLYSLEVRGAER